MGQRSPLCIQGDEVMDDRTERDNLTGQETRRVDTPAGGQDTPPTGYATVPTPPPPPPYSHGPVAGDRHIPEGQRRHNMTILGPVLLVAAGVVFLLNNLDILPWSIWGSLWMLWPLVLIGIGLDTLFGRRSPALSGIIVLALLAGGIAWIASGGGFEGWGRTASRDFYLSLEEAKSARVEVEIGSATLNLGPIVTGTGMLAEASLEYHERNGEPQISTVDRDDSDHVVLRLEEEGGGGFPFSFGGGDLNWNVRLNRTVPLEVRVGVGSGDADLNLRDLRANSLDLDIGSGNVTAIMPVGAGQTEGEGDIGSGNLTLIFPPGVAADIEADIGSGNVNTDPGFRRDGDHYTLEPTGDVRNRVNLRLDVGSGNINLRTEQKP